MMTQQNTDAEPGSETRSRRNWNGWDVFFIVMPVLCIILVPLGGLSYLCGRLGFYFHISFMLFFFIGCFIVFCIVYGVEKLLTRWKRHTGKKRFIIALEIVTPIVFILSCIALFCMPFETFFYPAGKPFMYGFRDRIKSRADIGAIRDWLKTLDKEDLDYYKKHPGYIRSHHDELPESVKAIGGSVGFSTDQNGNHILHCSYGGTFFYWGVEIGAEDMEFSQSYYYSRIGYRMQVEPGFNIVGW